MSFFGGKLETGATVSYTLLEEVKGEVNVFIELKQLCYLEQYQSNHCWVVVAIFLAQINSACAVQISNEHMEYGFFLEGEIKSMSTPSWVGYVIRNKL